MHNHSNLIVGALVVAVVLAVLGVPVLAYLPLVAVFAVCALMMSLMMRGMDHGAGRDRESADSPESSHRH